MHLQVISLSCSKAASAPSSCNLTVYCHDMGGFTCGTAQGNKGNMFLTPLPPVTDGSDPLNRTEEAIDTKSSDGQRRKHTLVLTPLLYFHGDASCQMVFTNATIQNVNLGFGDDWVNSTQVRRCKQCKTVASHPERVRPLLWLQMLLDHAVCGLSSRCSWTLVQARWQCALAASTQKYVCHCAMAWHCEFAEHQRVLIMYTGVCVAGARLWWWPFSDLANRRVYQQCRLDGSGCACTQYIHSRLRHI